MLVAVREASETSCC